METPFRAVSFVKHDIITKQSVDQLQSNYQWITDNTPRGRFYRSSGEPKPKNLLILAGRVKVDKNTKRDSATVNVKYKGNFHPKCHPAITTGVVADFQRKIFCVIHGPGGYNYPNNNGFQVSVNIAADAEKQDHIKKDFWVHWSAMGFRRDDINEF